MSIGTGSMQSPLSVRYARSMKMSTENVMLSQLTHPISSRKASTYGVVDQ